MREVAVERVAWGRFREVQVPLSSGREADSEDHAACGGMLPGLSLAAQVQWATRLPKGWVLAVVGKVRKC